MKHSPHALPLLLTAILLAGASHGAIADPLPSVQSFFQSPQTTHVTMSPKGGHVALVSTAADGTQALLVRDTAAPTKGKSISNTTANEEVVAVHWINERRLGFTVKNLRVEFESNLDEFATDIDGGNLVHLISGNRARANTDSIDKIKSLVLSFDYGYFGVTHDGSDDILVEKYSWNHIDAAPEQSRLYRLNTRTRQLTGASEGTQPPASLDWLTDNDDVPRIVSNQVKGRCATYYRKPGGDAWTELEGGACHEGARFTPLFFDGADALYVRASDQGYGALFRYDLKTMKLDKESFIAIPGFDFVGAPKIDWPSKRLLGIHLQADAATTIWLDPVLKAEQARIDAALPGAGNDILCAAECLATPVLLVASTSDRKPTQYLLYTRASGKLVALGSAHPDIKPAQMGLRDFHLYKARDGRSIPAYVTTPPGKAAGPLPTVVLVHGGPWVRGAYWGWDAQAQFLASRGYLVIQPEYRGSTGFGYAHFRAGWKQWGGAMQDDLADAAQWAVKQGWADAKRVCIMGASYGGYATLMGLIKNPEIFRCGVEWAGVTDIQLMFSSTVSDMSREWLNYGARTLIGDPDQDAAALNQHSPLLRAAEIRQPLLMAHGAQDRRVPMAHALSFRDAVQKNNPNVSSIIYSEEGHGWRHDKDNIDFWSKVESFLDQNLKPSR